MLRSCSCAKFFNACPLFIAENFHHFDCDCIFKTNKWRQQYRWSHGRTIFRIYLNFEWETITKSERAIPEIRCTIDTIFIVSLAGSARKMENRMKIALFIYCDAEGKWISVARNSLTCREYFTVSKQRASGLRYD